MAGKGGARPGAGRKRKPIPPGPQFRITAAQKRQNATSTYTAIFGNVVTPLDILAQVMMGNKTITRLQFEAAKAAAPYAHAKLQSITMRAAVKKDISDFSDDELLAVAGPLEDGGEGEGEEGTSEEG